jgi:hypothetical protein
MSSLNGRNITKNITLRTYFRHCLMRRSIFHARKPRSIFQCIWTTWCATMSVELSMNFAAWRFSELLIHPTGQTSICATFGLSENSQGKVKDRHLQVPEKILTAFQELWENITFEELQMVFESWRNQLCWIIEHDGEYFRKWHICNSAIW